MGGVCSKRSTGTTESPLNANVAEESIEETHATGEPVPEVPISSVHPKKASNGSSSNIVGHNNGSCKSWNPPAFLSGSSSKGRSTRTLDVAPGEKDYPTESSEHTSMEKETAVPQQKAYLMVRTHSLQQESPVVSDAIPGTINNTPRKIQGGGADFDIFPIDLTRSCHDDEGHIRKLRLGEKLGKWHSVSGIPPQLEVGRQKHRSINIRRAGSSSCLSSKSNQPGKGSTPYGFGRGPITVESSPKADASVSGTTRMVSAPVNQGNRVYRNESQCSGGSQTSKGSMVFALDQITFLSPKPATRHTSKERPRDVNLRRSQTMQEYKDRNFQSLFAASKNSTETANVSMDRAMLHAINAAQTQYIEKMDPNALFAELLDQTLFISKAEAGFVGETPVDSEGNHYLFTHAITDLSWDETSKAFFERYRKTGFMFKNLNSLYGHTIKHKRVVISDDPTNDPRGAGFPAGHPKLYNYCGIPLLVGNRIVGMIGLANRPQGIDEEFIEEMRPLINTATSLIEAYTSDRALQKQKAKLERDVRRRTEELENQKAELQAVINTRQQFFCKIVHEVRNPLSGIQDNVSLLLDGENLTNEQVQSAKDISQSAQILNEKVTEILDLAKLQEGKMQVRNHLVKLAVVEECIKSAAGASASRKGLSLEVVMNKDSAPTFVISDFSKLRDVVLNYVNNAIKYCKSRIHVSISACYIDDEFKRLLTIGKNEDDDEVENQAAPSGCPRNEPLPLKTEEKKCTLTDLSQCDDTESLSFDPKWEGPRRADEIQRIACNRNIKVKDEDSLILIEVQDDGAGIPQEVLKSLFIPYNKGEDVGGYSKEGTGLGLAIIHELALVFRGDAWALSNKGQGSRFCFILPSESVDEGTIPYAAQRLCENVQVRLPPQPTELDIREEQERLGLEVVAISEDERKRILGDKKIVIADDSSSGRKTIKRRLAKLGAKGDNIVVADDGGSALEQVESMGADVLLLDMHMTKIHGKEVIETLSSKAAQSAQMGDDLPSNFPYIIIVTGDSWDDIKYLWRQGIRGYAQKGDVQGINKAIIHFCQWWLRYREGKP